MAVSAGSGTQRLQPAATSNKLPRSNNLETKYNLVNLDTCAYFIHAGHQRDPHVPSTSALPLSSNTVIMREMASIGEMAPIGEVAPGCGKRSKKEIFNEQWPKYGTPGSPMAKTGYPFPR